MNSNLSAPAAPAAAAAALSPTRVFNSIQRNNIQGIRSAINSGYDINQYGPNGKTPLHHASALGYLEIVKLLIQNGADLNLETVPRGSTPLHLAVNGQFPQVVSYLLQQGANVNAVDSSGKTPIFYAIGSDPEDLNIVGLLVENRANIDHQDSRLNTPLHYAVIKRNGIAIRKLLSLCANLNISDDDGKTPYDIADQEVRRFIDDLRDPANPSRIMGCVTNIPRNGRTVVNGGKRLKLSSSRKKYYSKKKKHTRKH